MSDDQEQYRIDVMSLVRPANKNEAVIKYGFIYALKKNMPYLASILIFFDAMVFVGCIAFINKEYQFLSSSLIVLLIFSCSFFVRYFVSKIFERSFYFIHGRFNLLAELRKKGETIFFRAAKKKVISSKVMLTIGWIFFMIVLLIIWNLLTWAIGLEPDFEKWFYDSFVKNIVELLH